NRRGPPARSRVRRDGGQKPPRDAGAARPLGAPRDPDPRRAARCIAGRRRGGGGRQGAGRARRRSAGRGEVRISPGGARRGGPRDGFAVPRGGGVRGARAQRGDRPALRALEGFRSRWYRTGRMSGRTWGRTCIAVALAFLTVSVPRARAAEVRVISGPGPATTVTIEATPDVAIEDRTPGAKPAVGGQGPASTGETVAGARTPFA